MTDQEATQAARLQRIDRMTRAAAEEMQPALDRAFLSVVTNQVGADWAGDVDPLTMFHFDEALHGVLACLIGNAIPDEENDD